MLQWLMGGQTLPLSILPGSATTVYLHFHRFAVGALCGFVLRFLFYKI